MHLIGPGCLLLAATSGPPSLHHSEDRSLLMREVVLISSADYEAALAACNWTPEGAAAERLLNPAERARCRSLRRVCRLRCGLPADDGAAAVPAGAAGGGAPPPAALGPGGGVLALVGAARKIKLSSVGDQSLDAEITPLSSLEVRQ